MESSLKWVTKGVIALFLILTLWVGFLAVLLGPKYRTHPRNPRPHVIASESPRGGIFASQGEPLSVSLQAGDGFVREYLAPSSLAHVVGYAHVRFGLAGLEASFNRSLLGSTLWPIPRSNLITTIDLGLQEVAARQLGDRNGAIVALDPRDGSVLAMVSQPAFHPANLDRLLTEESAASPLLNRATQGLYPPGSTMKPVILAAALESRSASLDRPVEDRGFTRVGGRPIRNWDGEALGAIGFDDALALSSNAVFAELAAGLAPKVLHDMGERFGLGRAPAIEIPAGAGHLPSAVALQSEAARAEYGIGQGGLLVTPLQMAVVAATIAADGLRPVPTLARALQWPGGRVESFAATPPVRALSPGTARVIRDAMVRAVAIGTAGTASIEGVSVAGKTGSAENPHGRAHSWFIGFAPADDARIALAVLVEHGGYGSESAAPIARALFAAFFSQWDRDRGRR